MARIEKVSVDAHAIDVHRDLSMAVRAYRPGPPQRMDGMSIGIVHVTQDAPHAGEVHPDGDELLFVFPAACVSSVTVRLMSQWNLGRGMPASCQGASGTW